MDVHKAQAKLMSIEEVRAKLRQAEANREHWRKVAADPKLSTPAALPAHNLHRSYQAAAKLAQKALDYELAKAQPPYETSPPLVRRIFD